jgi:hypothetical protein
MPLVNMPTIRNTPFRMEYITNKNHSHPTNAAKKLDSSGKKLYMS